MTTTRLTRSAPLAHRLAHRYCAAGWRGRTAVWRLADRWPAPTCSVVQVAGGDLGVDRRFPHDREVYRGFFEVGELGLVARLIRPGDVCVDIGANVGVYSVLFASCTVDGPVFAFEPSPTFRRLEENLRRFNNATAFNLGLGAANGTLRLNRADGDHHANFREGTNGDTAVDVRRLDSIPEIATLPEVDFMKIDAEGWESQVMAGAHDLWNEHKVGMALVEVNPAWGPVDYLDAVERLGYRCFELRLRRVAAGMRHILRLQALSLADIPSQVNVLIVRPDRLQRLSAQGALKPQNGSPSSSADHS
jgi:FkbM family methyltransferase